MPNTKGKRMKKIARRQKAEQKLFEHPELVFVRSLRELLLELQIKYGQLHEVSSGTGHRLLDAITMVICTRLTDVVNTMFESEPLTCFNLTKNYRKKYPHAGDWPMIREKLREVRAEMNLPAMEAEEKQMLKCDNIDKGSKENGKFSEGEINKALKRIIDPIVKKIEKHIEGLDVESGTPEQTRVRNALKSNASVISEMYQNCMKRQLARQTLQNKMMRVRIYGEPWLPPVTVSAPVLKGKVHPRSMRRSQRLYNCVRLLIAPNKYGAFMSLDGTQMGPATLVCRPFRNETYRVKQPIVRRINEFFGLTGPGQGLCDELPESEGEMEEDEGGEGEEEPDEDLGEELML